MRDLNFATPLCDQLMNEVRSSNTDLDRERDNQINILKKSIQYNVDNYNVHTKTQAHFQLPFWESYEPQIVQVACGSIDKTTSNVLHNDYFQEINDWDQRERYVQPKSNLFFGNIDAKLQAPDNDVYFCLAALAAPVEQTISPARLVNPEVFKLSGNAYFDGKFVGAKLKQIPTAILVVSTMKVSSNTNKGTVRIGSVATCNGAEALPLEPDEFDQYGNAKSATGVLWGTR
jgi:hypothetical protein